MTRRDFYGFITRILQAAIGLLLIVPGVALLLDPLGKMRKGAKVYELCRIDELEVGVPRSVPIIDARQDAWVRYPREPIGLVWLVRQPEGTPERVLAFSGECPHLGCVVKLSADRSSFQCPCHNAEFALNGKPENRVAPRPLDRLDVEPMQGSDPTIRVQFQRFRAQASEKIPLA